MWYTFSYTVSVGGFRTTEGSLPLCCRSIRWGWKISRSGCGTLTAGERTAIVRGYKSMERVESETSLQYSSVYVGSI
ncbi:hypothetical protein ZHAS_00020296 [Anopheles sinensis]|uniref:Uncharacterized protein n=1 Tax=Anopheles sinensis TaxID=74873 RepID=A0A084WPP6_ANOSI|nr:hypothetical protein ZHAS_00020296 [Anopheles sinensis]